MNDVAAAIVRSVYTDDRVSALVGGHPVRLRLASELSGVGPSQIPDALVVSPADASAHLRVPPGASLYVWQRLDLPEGGDMADAIDDAVQTACREWAEKCAPNMPPPEDKP